MIAAGKLMPGYPVPVRAVYRHKPALLAQFDCNENRANMADGGRAYVGCLHLTSPMVRVCKTQIYRMRAHRPIESTSSRAQDDGGESAGARSLNTAPPSTCSAPSPAPHATARSSRANTTCPRRHKP